jgi:hypothetical protein
MASPFGKSVFRQPASNSSIRFGSLRGVEASRVAGASTASAVVVLCRSDSAGHGFALVMTSVEGSDLSGGNVGEGLFERSVRSCRQLYGAWHASSVDSVREAKGHERAAAMVHPFKASPRTQDREDRKRSWR